MPHQRDDYDPNAPNPLVAAVAHHAHLDEEGGDFREPPEDGSPAGPPRDPGGAGMGMLAWVLLIVTVGVTVWMQWLGPAPVAEAPATEMSPPGGLMRIVGRNAVGAQSLFGAQISDDDIEQLVGQIDDFAVLPEDRLRAVAVKAELFGSEAAIDSLDELLTALDERDEPLGYEDQLRADVEDMRGLLGETPVAPGDADAFRERHGWFGDLALAKGLEDENPARAPVLRKAKTTFVVFVTGVIGFVFLCVIGFVLGVLAIVFGVTGKLRAAYTPPAPGGSVYLEVFALFILGFIGVSYATGVLHAQTGVDYSRVLIWLLLLVPLWAILRGAKLLNFRYAMGWHTGKGLFREIGAGIVGYVACLPIFLLGIALTLLLVVVTSFFAGPSDAPAAPPTHPIIDELDPSSLLSVLGVYMVAAVWAPLVEESLFRGALFHHLRGRLHPIVAALAVGFVFAVIHPQGIIAVPALMSLGVVFCILREWRGSIIAPMVAHAMHNGALMTALILLLS